MEFTGDIVLKYTSGGEEYSSTFEQLDSSVNRSLELGVVHGIAIACGVLLMVLSWVIIIKKKNPIFVLNQLTLLLMVIKSSLYLAFLFGPLSSLTYKFTSVLPHDKWHAFHVYIATNVIHTFLIATVEMTLVFQIYIIFKSPEVRHLGYILTSAASALALTIVALYIHSTVISAVQLKEQLLMHEVKITNSWVNNVPIILFSASLNVVCIILIAKLALAIKTRRYLGLKQFDGLHILMITSTQTFIVPSVLMIVNYKQSSSYSTLLANISVILVVCNLPLSSLWAASANNSRTPTSSANTVFSRWDSKLSDTETIAHELPLIPGKAEKLQLVSPITEKGDIHTMCESHGDQDSIDKMLDDIEGAVMTTEFNLNNRTV
ncbi:hypothetical protein FDK38_003086 [Candidozyma auris]|nr:hypothetical protein FDK38_003086 [[Candida] auris]